MRRRRMLGALVVVGLLYGLTVLVELDQLCVWVEDSSPLQIETRRSHFCHQSIGTSCPSYREAPRQVIIVGILSFLGSRLAAHLVAKGLTVYGIASVTDMRLDNLVWYRREQLATSGVTVDIINFTNQTGLKSRILPLLSSNASLVYVPSLQKNSVRNSPKAEEFVSLLEVIQKWSNCTEMLLVSDTTGFTAIQKTWLESFELLLSSYHSMYGVPTVVLRVEGVYGPWSEQALLLHSQTKGISEVSLQLQLCWYVSDAVDVMYRAVSRNHKSKCDLLDLGGCQWQDIHFSSTHQNEITSEYILTPGIVYSWDRLAVDINQLHTVSRGIAKTLSWARAFDSFSSTKKVKNVIFTSYFTSEDDPQREKYKRPDHFSYLEHWYKSVVRLNMSAVIFHDGLRPQFQHKLTQYHSGVSLEFVPSLNGRSTNDARFYSYLNYLENHPDIHKVILTDISDVQFQMDPFQLMDLLGREWLYVGTDIDIFPTIHTMPWIHERLRTCFSHASSLLEEVMEMDTVFNAGVIGGTRELMLTTLTSIVGYLSIAPPQLNCNMPAVNIALHRHFFEGVFTGYPLTSRFLRKQESPKGVFIIHK